MEFPCEDDFDCPGNLQCFPDFNSPSTNITYCDCNSFWGFYEEPEILNITKECNEYGPHSYFILTLGGMFLTICLFVFLLAVFDFYTCPDLLIRSYADFKKHLFNHASMTWFYTMLFFGSLFVWRIITIATVRQPERQIVNKDQRKNGDLYDLELIVITIWATSIFLTYSNVAFVWLEVSLRTERLWTEKRFIRSIVFIKCFQLFTGGSALISLFLGDFAFAGFVTIPAIVFLLTMFIIGRLYFIRILSENDRNAGTFLHQNQAEKFRLLTRLIRITSTICLLTLIGMLIGFMLFGYFAYEGFKMYCIPGEICMFMLVRDIAAINATVGVLTILWYVRYLINTRRIVTILRSKRTPSPQPEITARNIQVSEFGNEDKNQVEKDEETPKLLSHAQPVNETESYDASTNKEELKGSPAMNISTMVRKRLQQLNRKPKDSPKTNVLEFPKDKKDIQMNVNDSTYVTSNTISGSEIREDSEMDTVDKALYKAEKLQHKAEKAGRKAEKLLKRAAKKANRKEPTSDI